MTYVIDGIDMSVDILHLCFINIIWDFLEKTVFCYLFELKEELRAPCEVYLRKHGIPVKLIKAQSLDEIKGSLTGRDAKVLVADAATHIPALLEFANAEESEIEATGA